MTASFLCGEGVEGLNLPAGEDAGGGEEDDRDRVGGTQQPVAVERRRDLLAQLLAQRHPGGGGQLPAIGGVKSAAEGRAPRDIRRPAGTQRSELNTTARLLRGEATTQQSHRWRLCATPPPPPPAGVFPGM